MLEINIDTSIDNINFLEFLKNQQENEDGKKQNGARKFSSPPQEEEIK